MYDVYIFMIIYKSVFSDVSLFGHLDVDVWGMQVFFMDITVWATQDSLKVLVVSDGLTVVSMVDLTVGLMKRLCETSC